ncbi:MAG: Rap1a/Tai family immunity protein [Candidatus Sulfotelmatobacter sp.]
MRKTRSKLGRLDPTAMPENLSDTLSGMKIALICLLFLAFNLGSFADASTGLELRDACRATRLEADTASATKLQVMKMVRCVAYVDGVTDGWVQAGGRLCAPQSATLEEYGAAVSKYLEDHPEELHSEAGVLVIRAMNHAWPCK